MTTQQQYPPAAYPPPPPPKKKHTLRNVLLVILGLFLLGGFASCMLAGAAIKAVDDESKKEHTVLYEVTSESGTASVTYTKDGNMAQETAAKTPWKKEIKQTGFNISSFSATNSDKGGKISCKLTIDGKVEKTAEGAGPFASVSCTK